MQQGSEQRYDLDGQELSWDSILEALDTSVNEVVSHDNYTSIQITMIVEYSECRGLSTFSHGKQGRYLWVTGLERQGCGGGHKPHDNIR